MSEGEMFVMLGSLALGVTLWIRWYAGITRVSRMVSPHAVRLPLYLAPALGGVLLLAVLRTLAAVDVRDSSLYTFFYLVFGGAWVAVTFGFARLAGVNARDDAVERGNAASSVAAGGGILALTLCFAGANIGNGPGWWVVLFSAALSTGALYAFWVALARVNRWPEAVAVDRDLATGIRVGAWLVALGLILGRAVAGDWVSAPETVVDFIKIAWAALVLFGVEYLTGRMALPSPALPRLPLVTYGLLPAALYLAAAIGYVLRLGLAVSGLETGE